MLLALGVGLGGCQFAGDPPAAAEDVPDAEISVLASNELNALGRSSLANGFHGKAERYFRAAVERNGEDLSSWIGLAAAYDNLARFDLADRAYEAARRIGGDTATILNNRGYSLLLRGDPAGAERFFRRAISLEPKNPVVAGNIDLARSGERPTTGQP